MENIVPLEIGGARGKVELEGVLGVFAKVLVDGTPVRAQRGVFPVPLKGGRTASVRLRGFLPGFQKVLVDGEQVMALGSHVPMAARITMFAPLLLVLAGGYGPALGAVGLVLGLLLFFLSILVVKNDAMPVPMRVALPVVNTIAAGIVILVFAGALG
ncbi:hypothetical protein [Demequina zhanjiangensis]|uniref:Uncharacterized protein n=1 Tax=Demequina zhanjiangensis TaxID=3051659 RepID=A0ABT8G3K9_9MICO|nr:hypothetical protein [Demequina sp. SYSU T00b26]MDN4473708.1 hypothetical protein [Demequina sp. SYSU T00b26]